MSTNWQYTPVSSGDVDSVSREQQEPTRSVYSHDDRQEKLQSSQEGNLKPHQGDTSQTTLANADKSDILEIPNWPEPRTLKITRGKSILHSVGNILSLIPPLFFLVLVLSSIGLHSKRTSSFGRLVIQACLLELERVIASQTVFSFLRFAFAFKQLDRLCIVLGILWSLSPLGGQGVLRMLSMKQIYQESTETIRYLDLYGLSEYQNSRRIPVVGTMVNGLYISSLFAPPDVKNRTTDLWGAIKTPSIEALDFDHQGDDGVAVGDVSNYMSLIGIPINSTVYKVANNYTFTLNATVFTTQCQEPESRNSLEVPYLIDGVSFTLETQYTTRKPYEVIVTQRNISSITFAPQTEYAVIHNCTLVPNCLLAKVECSSGHCGVTRIKKLEHPIDQLPIPMLGSETWLDIVQELPKSTGNNLGHSSQTELYLYDPQQLKPNITGLRVDLREVPIEEFSRRFATVINTYYQATLSPGLRMQSLISGDPSMMKFLKTKEAKIHILSPNTYQRHWEWVISALVASLAMLVVAITSILLERQVISPDIYGYVSSMTRDSPYFPLPPNGCTLEGAERAVLLKDVVVRIQDVTPNKEVGHIAFTMTGYKKPTQQLADCRLRKTKMYSGSS
ncbi:hypothetical protein CPB86DRAFT_875906 [Serendipita vermifera]|nr:hypothetical protein CPB86DRAFT_875906 [Serendipita vermifera]